MGIANSMKNGVVMDDDIKFDLVEKQGKPMMFFKKYKSKVDQYRPFNSEIAMYHNKGKKGFYEVFIDYDTLLQLAPDEAFKSKQVDNYKARKYQEAGDVLAAQKETKKRMESKQDYLRDLIIYGALVIISMFIFLSTYYAYNGLSNLKTITIHCDNCQYGAAITTTIPQTVANSNTGSPTIGTTTIPRAGG